MAVLVIAEYHGGQLAPATGQCVHEVHKAGQPVDLLLVGKDSTQCALPDTVLENIRTLYRAEASHLAGFLPEEVAPVIRGVASGYGMVVAAHSNVVAPVMARVAALLGVCPLLGVTRMPGGVSGQAGYDCPVYGGAILQTVQPVTQVQVVTASLSHGNRDETFLAPDNWVGYAVCVVDIDLPVATGLTQLEGLKLPSGQGNGLGTARLVIGCGGGVQGPAQMAQVESLADRLGAAIGGSKVAVDNGLVPVSQLVGQSGRAIAPEIYLALGISGSMHHLSAVLDSSLIISVNKDGEASIFSFADYGLVGDIGDIVPELEKELSKPGQVS